MDYKNVSVVLKHFMNYHCRIYLQFFYIIIKFDFLLSYIRYQDGHNQVWFAILSASSWMGIRLDFLGIVFLIITVFSCLFMHTTPGEQPQRYSEYCWEGS